MEIVNINSSIITDLMFEFTLFSQFIVPVAALIENN